MFAGSGHRGAAGIKGWLAVGMFVCMQLLLGCASTDGVPSAGADIVTPSVSFVVSAPG